LTSRREIAVRVVTVIAATFLVAAFSLALLLPAATTLGELVAMADGRALVVVQGFARAHLPDWAWGRLFVPLLARPGWLSPMALGVVAIGVAVSLRSHQSAPRRRRS